MTNAEMRIRSFAGIYHAADAIIVSAVDAKSVSTGAASFPRTADRADLIAEFVREQIGAVVFYVDAYWGPETDLLRQFQAAQVNARVQA